MASNSLRIISNYIYFYHLDKFCILPLYPESVTDTMESKFTSTNALSRSAPVWTYINSGPRQVSLNFTLHRDMMNDLNKDISNINPRVNELSSIMLGESLIVNWDDEDYVDVLIKYLQSMSLPKYHVYDQNTKSVTPPMVAVRLGNEVFIKGVVSSSVQVTYKKPINDKGKYSVIDITFTVSEVDPYDAVSVVLLPKSGSFRGIAAGGTGNNISNE